MENALIDVHAPHIGASGIAVYAYLARRADRQGVCFPSYDTIARDLGLSRRTAVAYVKLLQEHGLIVLLPRTAAGMRRSTNAYRLVSLREGSDRARTAPLPEPQEMNAKADVGASPPTRSGDRAAFPAAPCLPLGTKRGAGRPTALDGEPGCGATFAPVQILHPSTAPDLLADGATVAPVQILHCVAADAGRSNGANPAPVQILHPSTAPDLPADGATVAPVQILHHAGAAVSPHMVQEMHHDGATVAPEGNPLKETQEKETQKKERKDDMLLKDDAGPDAASSLTSSPATAIESALDKAPTPSQLEPARDHEAAMMAALCLVTGKDLSLLREAKRREYTQGAARLQERGFTAEDVRDFADYWQEAHPIGSKKPNAGYPHLVQVLEDLAGALPWIQKLRLHRQEEDTWQAEGYVLPPMRPHDPEVDPEVGSLWRRIREELALRLPTPAIQADLHRAKPVSLSDGALLVELPSDATAEWWRLRLQRPVTDAVARVVEHPLSVTFTGPTVRPSPSQWSPS